MLDEEDRELLDKIKKIGLIEDFGVMADMMEKELPLDRYKQWCEENLIDGAQSDLTMMAMILEAEDLSAVDKVMVAYITGLSVGQYGPNAEDNSDTSLAYR